MNEIITINKPQIGEQEISLVTEVLRSEMLTNRSGNGPMVKKFERSFANCVKAKHAVAMNSGTASLHATLLAIGTKPGDEVIVPSFTFVATAEVVAIAGAKPVFVDINPNDYTMDPEKIEERITKKTKAIIPVDLYGFPADMNPIVEIAKEHGLYVVEDAAQALGSRYRKQPTGYLSDATCWSFYASKNMTTGEGGMVTTNSDDLSEKLCAIRTHGEDEKHEYVSIMLGHNYRMPEIEAAIGYVQLQRLREFLERRKRNAKFLTEKLEGLKNIQLPREEPMREHSWYLYTVRLKNFKKRDTIVRNMNSMGIQSTVHYGTPIHCMPCYRQFADRHLPETEKATEQVLQLPIHPGVTTDQINHISDSFISTLLG